MKDQKCPLTIREWAEEMVNVQPMTEEVGDILFMKYSPSKELLEEVEKTWCEDNPKEKYPDYQYEEISLFVFDLLTRGRDVNEIIQYRLQSTDIICTYNSPDWTWGSLCGRAGICVIRNNMIVAFYCLRMS